MLTIGGAYYELRNALFSLYDEGEATAVAQSALEFLTGWSKLERLSKKDSQLSDTQSARFQEVKEALLSGQPLQYVTGESWFLGRRFSVGPAVLIPRPETEELVDWIVQEERPESILDIGTGSGCIAVSLKLALPASKVTAVDVSEAALEVARNNAMALGADISILHQDILDTTSWPLLGRFDLIVSNPPYIPVTEAGSLHPNVRDHEPGTALFVPGNDPLLFYRMIARMGLEHLSPRGAIYCELHRDFASETAALFQETGYQSVLVKEDLHGAPRMLQARFVPKS